ncbi:MAG: uroporphyrinogen decarboxylase family protein [Kiritimatiellia bacterium]|jgi:uroporphyrinogen decarboxylase
MMTGKERISRQLKRQSVDRIGAFESFWSFTRKNWVDAGRIPEDQSCVEHFDLDIENHWVLNLAIQPEFKEVVLAEDEETCTVLDGNGAKLRRHKHHATTPEHLGYAIANRQDWEEKARPFLVPSANRLSIDNYRAMKETSQRSGRFFCTASVNAFEAIHPIAGHENMLVGMALDPDWVLEMAMTYADLIIALYEELFAQAGKPDGVWFFEDMGFKGRPFMSPDMYRELIMPAHKKTIDYLHSLGLPVVLHSCGFVEPLLPGLVEAGIDCLQAIEVKAGMDLLKIYKDFGDRISLMGGLDVRPVASNDLEGVKRELESKIPFVMKNNGFIFHSDHSIPESTDYETYKYFLELGRKLGTY